MGNSSSRPLEEWSPDHVADAVVALGTKYEVYANAIRENAIDGGLLMSLETDEMDVVFEELGVSSKIHRKVMSRALIAAKQKDNSGSGESTTTTTTQASSSMAAAVDGANMSNGVTPRVSHQVESKQDDNPAEEDSCLVAAEAYGLTSFSPFSDVEGFDDISTQAMQQNPDASYAGIHLCLTDGVHTLSSKMRTAVGMPVSVDRSTVGVVQHSRSLCSKLVRESSDNFLICEEYDEYKDVIGPTYVGHVITNDKGDRLGAVCHVSTMSVQDTQEKSESLRRTSAKLAALAEDQLRLREQLLMRNESLRQQIQQKKERVQEEKKQESEPSVTAATAAVHMPSTYVPNSALLPFARTNLATEPEEREHLPPNLFAKADELGIPRPPIGKDDMARVARVEALGIHNMDPDGPMAIQLKQILKMCAHAFDRPIVTLTVLNHAEELVVGCYDGDLKVFETMNVVTRDSKGSPFCVAEDRGVSYCNYTTHKRGTFVVPDLWADEAFKLKQGPRGYVGTSIITSDGYCVANLCMLDIKPRYDFSPADQVEFEKIALLLTQNIENWELRQTMDRLVQERKLLEQFTSKAATLNKAKRDAPTGDVTIVLTDIQGSTALWEADAAAMKAALVLHDQILRNCSSEHNGYEIKTEGDAFHLAFHDPVDAIDFALQTQIKLYQAAWSDDILALADAAADESGLFRGPRVRMGIHHGPSTPQVNEVSGRVSYAGVTFRLAKSIEALCYGGQILVSAETWRMVSKLREQLGSPQVVDYGEYVLMTGESITDGIIAKGIVQLVPKRLAFDYFNQSGDEVTTTSGESLAPGSRPRGSQSQELRGRQFPRTSTKRKLTTSFLDAPSKNGEVTMMFVYPHGVDNFSDDLAEKTFSVLTKAVRSLLLQVSPPGYECQEDKGKWMIAFQSLTPAVNFGLLLMEAVSRVPFDDEVDTGSLLKIGIHSGAFSGMCPHPMTGRADYFGPVVNRAARVTAAAEPGKVYVGVPVVDPAETPPPPNVGAAIAVNFVGVKDLKGVSTGMALFCCEDKVKRRVSMMLKEVRPAGKKVKNRKLPTLIGRSNSDGSKDKKAKRSFLRPLRGRKVSQ